MHGVEQEEMAGGDVLGLHRLGSCGSEHKHYYGCANAIRSEVPSVSALLLH